MRGSKGGGGAKGSDPPEKSQKIKGFLVILARIRYKPQSYQASIQCLAIIGTPAKRHLASETPFTWEWRFAGGPMIAV